MDEILYDYYLLEAYADKEVVLEYLDILESGDKIFYTIEDDLIHIENLDMTSKEINKLILFLETNDVVGYDNVEEDGGDDDIYDSYYDEFDDYDY